ncbi:GNAT family N-acetyltransferase [Pseudomonas turukhanskensis]|uniref:N-acetyltransferase n=1 Tax=Pseudomonas turukhanskensis TaxID=1806536 RepID=A0A9W6K3L2_9PSED|nr:GNAT family N-acetyltransferase [Pseudomonas turukhanskensis]GLK88142.1 N-acetyltransferase [Pseudomonas turukhanskensis]
MSRIQLRNATPDDVSLILSLIHELAVYEKLSDQAVATPEDLTTNLFGPRPFAEVLIGELDGEPQGFALFFPNFSTFLGKPGIYLEDLYVREHARSSGLGKALLARLAQLAVQRGCGRLEWSVLDWNEPALGFYRRLGARPQDDWTTYRLSGAALAELGKQAE